jgi:hypothetical protein
MKASLLAIMAALSFNVFAYTDDPTAPVKINTPNKTMTVSFRFENNPTQACERESRKVGNGGFGYAVLGCSFWTSTECVIIVGKTTNQHTLGHEVLHCIKGNWHE